MFTIKLTRSFKDVISIYGNKNEVLKRYRYFLKTFGLEATKAYRKNLFVQLSKVPGGEEYKKSLVVAEFRDKGWKSWFAVVGTAINLNKAFYDPATHVIMVEPRLRNVAEDPVTNVLEKFGPWTVDTLPFVPSARTGQAVLVKVSEKEVIATKEKNISQGEIIKSAMTRYGVIFDDRREVYMKLKVVRDLEVEAIRQEFGLDGTKRPAWRPSLRWLWNNAAREVVKRNAGLIKVWTDPKFKKYRVNKRLRVQLNRADIKRLQNFQDKVRV